MADDEFAEWYAEDSRKLMLEVLQDSVQRSMEQAQARSEVMAEIVVKLDEKVAARLASNDATLRDLVAIREAAKLAHAAAHDAKQPKVLPKPPPISEFVYCKDWVMGSYVWCQQHGVYLRLTPDCFVDHNHNPVAVEGYPVPSETAKERYMRAIDPLDGVPVVVDLETRKLVLDRGGNVWWSSNAADAEVARLNAKAKK